MKREQLLTGAANKENNEIARQTLVKKEKRKLEKALSDLKYELEQKECEMEERMSKEVEVDMAVVAVQFAGIKNIKTQISNLQDFIKTYYEN
jgi:hypothetical protein